MKVVVTGGAGFIASHIADALLDAGHDITIVDDFSSGRNENIERAFELSQTKGLKFRVLRASISDAETWQKMDAADVLVHFAAQTSVTASVENPQKDFDINVGSTINIVKWLRAKKVRMVVYANTAGAMYGRAAHYPSDERTLPRPLAPYGATKAFFESYLSALTESLKASGEWSSDPKAPNYFSWVAARLSNVYGPRQITKGEAGVVPIFCEQMGRGETPTIFGDGNKTRDYVHVSDVVTAVMLSLEKMQIAHLDEGFNIATSVETRDLDVFQGVMRAMHEMGSDPDSPEPYRHSLKVSQPDFADVRPGEVLRSVLDINKAEAMLGWRPRVQIHNGIKDTVINYFKK